MLVKTRTEAIYEIGRLTGNIVASSNGAGEISEGYTSYYEPEGSMTISTCGRDRDEREHHELKDVAGLQYVERYGYMVWYKENK
jgi:hypothetical protein